MMTTNLIVLDLRECRLCINYRPGWHDSWPCALDPNPLEDDPKGQCPRFEEAD